MRCAVLYLVAQSCLTLWDPMDCSPPGSFVYGDSPDKNTGEGCHAILQGFFLTQGSNPGVLHCRQILYCLSHQGSPYYEMCVCVKSLSHVRLFATLWTVARQAPLFMGFSRQEYWSGSPFPSPGIFPTQGSNLGLLLCRQTLYPLSHQGSPYYEILLSN